MKGTTHALAGLVAGIVFYSSPIPILLVVVGALFPDIDKVGSTISKRLPFGRSISTVVELSFTHRGFFHSLWIPALLFVTTHTTSYFPQPTSYPLLLGYCSHLVLDACTLSGIRPLYPFNMFHVKGNIKTGGWKENFFVVVLLAFLLILVTKLL